MKKSHTLEEYKEIGERFKHLDDLLGELIIMVGKKGKLKYGDKIFKVSWKLNDIRSDLENEMFKDYPEEATIDYFYGERKHKFPRKLI